MKTYTVDIEYLTKKDVRHEATLGITAHSAAAAERQARQLITENGQRQCKEIISAVATEKGAFMLNKGSQTKERVGLFGRIKERLFSHA